MGFIKKAFSQFTSSNSNQSGTSGGNKNNDALSSLDDIRKMQSSVQQGLFETQQYYEKAQQMFNNFGLSGKNVSFLNKVPEFLGQISKYNSMIQTRLGYIRTTEKELKNFIGKIKQQQKEKLDKEHGSFYNLADPRAIRNIEGLKYNQELNHDPLLSPPENVPDDSEGNITEWEDKTNRKGDKIFKSWQSNGKPVWSYTIEEPFDKRQSDKVKQLRKVPGSMPFFIEKLHGRTIDNKTYKVNKINEKDSSALSYPNRMVFPAFVDTYDDSYSTEWSDYSFIGRPDSVYIHNKTTRTISLTFYLITDFSADIMINAAEEINKFYKKKEVKTSDKGRKVQNSETNIISPEAQSIFDEKDKKIEESGMAGDLTLDEQRAASFYMAEYIKNFLHWGTGTANVAENLPKYNLGFIPGTTGTPEQMWARATFLAQSCYPWYRKDGKIKEQPFIRLRLGDWFDVIAKVDNLSFAPEDFGWDLNVSPNIGNIPMGMKVTMSLTIIHEDTPTSDYARFYYRKDFDTENLNYIPDVLKQSLSKDAIIDKYMKDSQAFQELFHDQNISDNSPGSKITSNEINDENCIPLVAHYAQHVEDHSRITEQFKALSSLPQKNVQMGKKLAENIKSSAKLIKTKQMLKDYFKHGDSKLTKELNKLANAPLKIIKEINQYTDFNIADKFPGMVDKLEAGEKAIKGVDALSGIGDSYRKTNKRN